MKKYVALLRGINVGGKNKIPMPELREAFKGAGFSEVSTYINSGNVIFLSDMEDELSVKTCCEEAIIRRFGLNIPVAILSKESLGEAMEAAPGFWGVELESKHNAIFTIQPATGASVAEAVGAVNPEYEQVAVCGPIIFWSAPIKTFSRTKYLKAMSTPIYEGVTIRNANTARKLYELMR